MSLRHFQDPKILVVGGVGFVGSNLVSQLLLQGSRNILIVDNLLSAEAANLPRDPRVGFLRGSIADDRILARLAPSLEYVFHLACYHGNQSSIADPLADHRNNTLTTLKLLETIRSFPKLKKVVYAAAGCAVAEKTFKAAQATPEDAPVSLFHDSPYSISKLIGEMYGNYYWRRHGVPFVKARFQNVYGPREILGAGRWRGSVHTVWRNVVPTFIWKSLNGEALPLENGGKTSRDFIFVEDLVRGLLACAERGEPGEAYNLASGREATIAELAGMINEITGNPIPPDFRPARDWDRSGRRFGAVEKSRRKLGFRASTTMREGLQKTIDWTRAHRALIRRTMRKHDGNMRRIGKVVS